MNDIYYFNSPYGNPFIVRANWPDDIRKVWIDAMEREGVKAADPGLVPTFEEGYTIRTQDPGNPGQFIEAPLNPLNFATAETANAIMKRFFADYVALVPYGGADQVVNFSDAKERWLVWANKFGDFTAINAGQIAKYFAQNPELLFPHVAENLAWQGIISAIGQKLPTPIVAVAAQQKV